MTHNHPLTLQKTLFIGSEYAVSNDNVFEFKNSGVVNAVRDTLTEVPREGARDLLVEAVEAEVAELLGQYRSEQDRTGRARMVCATATCRRARSRRALAMCR